MGFAGFDRSDYPGPAAMKWLRANTNLVWCGFYLGPAPSHPDTSWMNAADDDLADWGLAPIFLGQETTGPGSHLVTAAQGVTDGALACALMEKAGFDKGSVVYLDNEAGPPMLQPMASYVAAWCGAVMARGYTPGVYCSFLLGEQTRHICPPSAKIWVYHVKTTAEHRVPSKSFPNPEPKTSGYGGSDIWQLDDEAIIPCAAMPNGLLVVDLNSADSADPGQASPP